MGGLIFKQKGVGCKKVPRGTLGQNHFGHNILCEIGLNPPPLSAGRALARRAERTFARNPESAPRDPLFPVILITGNSDSFKIKHLAVSKARGPRQTLHLVVASVRGPWLEVRVPCLEGRQPRLGRAGRPRRGPRAPRGPAGRLPFPSFSRGRLSDVVVRA